MTSSTGVFSDALTIGLRRIGVGFSIAAAHRIVLVGDITIVFRVLLTFILAATQQGKERDEAN